MKNNHKLIGLALNLDEPQRVKVTTNNFEKAVEVEAYNFCAVPGGSSSWSIYCNFRMDSKEYSAWLDFYGENAHHFLFEALQHLVTCEFSLTAGTTIPEGLRYT